MYTEGEVKYNTFKSMNKFSIIIVFIISICIIAIIMFFNNKPQNMVNEIIFQLNGGDIILNYQEKYVEPGFRCYNINTDLTNLVKVTNNISNLSGEYNIIYECQNKILIRKVTILEPSNYEILIDYSIDNNNYTNEDIKLSYTISGETFKKVILPDGTDSNELSGTITISSNGIYQIKAYNIQNQEFIKEISVNNIDKEKPAGTCHALVKNKSTQIDVDAKDNIEIIKYEYYDSKKLLDSSNKKKYTTNFSTSSSIMVKAIDEAGNISEIICSITDKRYQEPIKPSANENVIFTADTDTLKAYIIKKNSYYLTRIWVMDAYTQFNKAASPSYGNDLYKPMDLVNNDINNKKLQNKAIVGFNTSGFYLKGNYDSASVDKYPAYNKTAVGTIIINDGRLIRNAYNKAFKQWYIMGINKDNQMVIFEDNPASTELEINNKLTWSQTVINSGIRNTFNFAGPVILNGKKLSTFSQSMPDPLNKSKLALQLICQINDNNFALFTSSSEIREIAINEFLNIGCKTATNLDGGGSIALFYKAKNATNFTRVIGANRALPEIGYFNE